MANLKRNIQNQIVEAISKDKVIALFGPRQVGKTTLLDQISQQINQKVLRIDADRREFRQKLASQDLTVLRNLVAGNNIVMIDEAQRVPDIGLNLKIMHDNIPELKIIATGSSSFDLSESIREPLTGRLLSYMLYPFAYSELVENQYIDPTSEFDENLLIYGMYPEIIQEKDLDYKRKYLEQHVEATLFKDILDLANLKNPSILHDLLVLLAYQIGQEVSMTELASNLSVAKETVQRYLDLLQKAFIIFKIKGFSRNLRKEVSKNARYYFVDIGIRNAIIRNFNPIKYRNDQGIIWENWLISERIKKQTYTQTQSNNYFWRTYTQEEIDWVEESMGQISTYEIKWSNKKTPVFPKEFEQNYPNSTFQVVSRDNFYDFIV